MKKYWEIMQVLSLAIVVFALSVAAKAAVVNTCGVRGVNDTVTECTTPGQACATYWYYSWGWVWESDGNCYTMSWGAGCGCA